jgi:hypothetical protein
LANGNDTDHYIPSTPDNEAARNVQDDEESKAADTEMDNETDAELMIGCFPWQTHMDSRSGFQVHESISPHLETTGIRS